MGHDDFMRQAIALAVGNVKNGGGPFGAVIVKDGRVVATGVNRVVPNNDPTAHAEVNAIRAACVKLGTFNLSGCVLYTSCEPCPMCLGAIYWAHIDKIYYGATQHDAAAVDLTIRSYTANWNWSLPSVISRWRISCIMRHWLHLMRGVARLIKWNTDG